MNAPETNAFEVADAQARMDAAGRCRCGSGGCSDAEFWRSYDLTIGQPSVVPDLDTWSNYGYPERGV